MRRSDPAVFGAWLAFWLISSSANAQAPSEEKLATAATLFQEGRELIAANRWDEGCAKFEASLALSPRASTLLNMGDCHAHAGKLVRALATYEQALTLNKDTQGEERRKELEQAITESLTVLRPRVPRLTIAVRTPPAELTVNRDGQALPVGSLGTALPVDPGAHEVVVSAPGHKTERRAITLAEGKTETVEITLAPIAPVVQAPSWWKQHRGSMIVGGTAIGLAGVGVGLGAWTMAGHAGLPALCAKSSAVACSDAEKGLHGRAIATNVLLGAAGVAAVTGVIVFFAAERGPKVAVSPTVGGAVVTVRY